MREFHSITLFFFKKICLVIFLGCLQLGYSQTYTVTNTNDSGPGSLRQGIQDANAGLVDTINFDLETNGVADTIFVSNAFPAVVNTVVIDGTSDVDYVGPRPSVWINPATDYNDLSALLFLNDPKTVIKGLGFNDFVTSINISAFSDSLEISFCEFKDHTSRAIFINENVNFTIIQNNIFGVYNSSVDGSGISGEGKKCHIISNYFGRLNSSFDLSLSDSSRIENNIIGRDLDWKVIPGGLAQIGYANRVTNNFFSNNFPFLLNATNQFNVIEENTFVYVNNVDLIQPRSAILIGGGTNNTLRHNDIIGMQEYGFEVFGEKNKISKNIFIKNENKSIHIGSIPKKDTATITSYTLSSATLTLSGNSDPQDSVEVFINDGTPQNALEYLGTAKADASGNWSLILDRESAFTEGSLNYYVTTATDMANNTSELSAPFVVLPENCIVTNANDARAGSLRAAMECAATMPGPDTITFNIPGSGEHMITLESSLPTIELDTVVIDGSTQPEGEIVLDGSIAPGINGITIESTALSGIKDLGFRNFNDAVIIRGCNSCFVDSTEIKNVSTGISLNFNSDSLKITNNHIFKVSNEGIALEFNVTNSTISNNKIDSSGNAAIDIRADADNNKIINNIFSNGDKVGIQMCCSAENTFLDNTIQNFGEGGISLSGAVNNNTFINNTILNNTDFGIKISDNSLRDTLIGNTIGGTSGVGVLFESGAKYHYLKGNYIGLSSAFDSLGTSSHGIQTNFGCNSISLINNYIGFSGQEGIRNASDSTTIKNNFIGANGTHTFPNLSNGIGFFAPSRYIKVRNNYIGENQGAGLFMQNYGTQGNLLSQNIFIDNAGEAIDMDVQTNGNSGNANKAIPYITAISRNGNEYTLTIEAETNDVLIEVFEGDSSRKNALAFLTDNLNNLGDGVWQTTITTEQTNPQFLVTSTAADSSTSALGFYIEDCFVVYSTADEGLGSLREAIACANMAPDTNTITFNIPGDGPHEIVLDTELPAITETVNIIGIQDGERVIITGNGGGNGLYFVGNSDSSVVEGIKVTDFIIGIASSSIPESIYLTNVVLENNEVGIEFQNAACYVQNSIIQDNSGRGVLVNGNEIYIDSSAIINNGSEGIFGSIFLIGNIENTYIYGNSSNGIDFSRVTQKIYINNCHIGVDSSGRSKKPNNGHGIYVTFSAASIISNCLIGGNNGAGIYDNDRVDLIILGNHIGTNKFGDNLGNANDGIFAQQADLTIGNNSQDSINIIGYNGGNGLYIISTSSTITGNYIGVSPNGDDIHNHKNGLVIQNGTTVENNKIGLNLENGIVASSGNTIHNNYIGIGPNGENWGNILYGIESSSSNDIIQNTIGNNGLSGIHSTSSFNWVSKTTFENNNGPAIDWDMARDTATITGRSILGNTLTLTGTGPEGDSVEVFLSDGLPQNALVYAGTALVNGGTWSLDILEDNVAFSTLQNNYYVTTATDNAQTSTSELSQPFLVPAYLCNITHTDLLSDTLGVCQNDSLLLASPVARVNTTWYKDETLYTNDSSFYTQVGGEYVLELEDTYGCKTYDTIQVVENPVPLVADFLVSSYTDIDDELVIVNVSYTQPDSVVWDFGNADVMDEGLYYVLTFPDTGSYEITLTSYLDYCVNSRTKTIEVLEEYSSPGNILKASFDIKSVQVFPNPTTGIFTAKVILTQQKDISWTFFDAQSNIVTYGALSGKSTYEEIIDIQSLPAGTYFLRITTDRDTRIVRIIKQ